MKGLEGGWVIRSLSISKQFLKSFHSYISVSGIALLLLACFIFVFCSFVTASVVVEKEDFFIYSFIIYILFFFNIS